MRRVLLILSTTLLVILLLLAGNLLVQGAWSETPRRKDGASSIGTTMIGPGNITASHLAAEPISTSFTYQGTLSDNGQPAEGAYDFLFALYPSLEGGAQVGSSVVVNDLTVSDGLFTVLLDFEQGLVLFNGTAYWLEIRVRPGAETGTHTILAPRQALTPTPNAIYASRADWDGLLNAPPGFVDGVDNDTLATLACADGLIAQAIGNGWQCANEEGDISGIDAGTGLSGGGDSGLISLELLAGQVLPQNCENGEIVEWTGSIWRCSQDDVGESGGGGDITGVLAGFGLEGGGESGTVTLDVLSTTMQSRVNGTCPDGSTIQGINQDGSVICQVVGDTTYTAGIGLELNGLTFTITSTYQLPQDCAGGQIITWNGSSWECIAQGSGGAGWSLTGNAGTTAGTNILGTTDDQALELHVNNLRVFLLEPNPTSPNLVAGYWANTVGADVEGATVGGGGSDANPNSVTADFGTVSGGNNNSAGGYASVIDGGVSNSTSGSYSAVGGGLGNSVTGDYANAGGGQQNEATGDHAAIGGGQANVADAAYATAAGGLGNVVTDTFGTIGGGQGNSVVGDTGTVGGGWNNHVAGAYGTIAGGGPADPGNPTTSNNRVLDDYGTVSGGGGNKAGNDDGDPGTATAATVAGGVSNSASNTYATSGGGFQNLASGYGATIAGGSYNEATANYAAIAGGTQNDATANNSSVGGGQGNSAGGAYSTIAGGINNQVTTPFGAIPGGSQNYVSGTYGFAAGYQARSEHQGSFVWSDSTPESFASTDQDQFLIDATGGVGIGTNQSTPTYTLSVGGNAKILSEGLLVARGTISNEAPTTSKLLQKVSAIDAAGDYIYVTAASTNTLSIVDISDPDHPDLLNYSTSGLHQPLDIQVEGGLAFIASELNNSLVILDISQAFSGTEVSGINSIGASNRQLDHPRAVHVVGNRAYVASYGDTLTGGLAIFDVSDPREPLNAGFTDANLDHPTDVFVSGHFAYVTSEANDSLVIFDISDRSALAEDAPIAVAGAFSDSNLLDGPSHIQVRGKYAYVLAKNSGMFVILDVSNTDNITVAGFQFTNLVHPVDMFLSGDLAYVAYEGEDGTYIRCGLAVFDVSNPADIKILSVDDMSANNPIPEKPVAVTGNGEHIFVANQEHHSVTIYDVNHLSAPAVTAGTVQANHIDSTGDAHINDILSVGHGLNVGPGGALIEGQLSVAGSEDNYILGNLSLGAAGIVLSDTEKTQIEYPTQRLDVHGDARFRINENHSLILASPPTKGAFIDLTTNNFGASYTPTARIEFYVPDPFAGTTHTTEVKILTQSESDTEVRGRMTIGEEIIFHNVDQDDPDLRLRTTITVTKNGDVLPGMDNAYFLGDPTHRWDAVYSEGGVIETSDERWKDDVSDLAYGLDEVKQLRPVSYSWREDPAGEMHYGLIAQEVLEILPEMVDLGQNPDDPLGLNYAELTPVLVSAIQEQQEQIESQAEQIATLEERLTALEGSGNGLFSGFNTLWGGVLVAVAMVAVGSRRWLGRRP